MSAPTGSQQTTDDSTGPPRGTSNDANPRSTPPSTRTLGQLVSDASHDVSEIVRAEVALAKAEVKRDLVRAVTGAALFLVAGVLAFLAMILLLIAAAYGIVAAGLDPWLAFLVVAGALLLITLVLALVGRSRLGRVGAPRRTIRSARKTLESLRSATSNHR